MRRIEYGISEHNKWYLHLLAQQTPAVASGTHRAVDRAASGLDALGVTAYPRRMSVKPGYKTTEFWATVAAVVPLLLNEEGVHRFLSTWHGGILLTIVTAAYVVSRGMAKRPG